MYFIAYSNSILIHLHKNMGKDLKSAKKKSFGKKTIALLFDTSFYALFCISHLWKGVERASMPSQTIGMAQWRTIISVSQFSLLTCSHLITRWENW